jgi:hypothetical protein
LDLGISNQKREYLSEAAQHLMNLAEQEFEGDSDDDEMKDYIEKNLYDFYDI